MKQLKFKLILALVILSGTFAATSPGVSALNCASPANSKEQIQCGACEASGASSCDPGAAPGTLNNTIKNVIDVLSVVAGAAAVVMIIVGGFRYVTSAGNPEQTKGARNTILYAIVGLIIIALAQIIVHFTLNNVVNSCIGGKTPSGQKCTP